MVGENDFHHYLHRAGSLVIQSEVALVKTQDVSYSIIFLSKIG